MIKRSSSGAGSIFQFLFGSPLGPFSRNILRSSIIAGLIGIFSPRHGTRAVTAFFQRAVCLNQGWLVEYSYLASRKHRDLKYNTNEDRHSNANIGEALDELNRYASQSFFEITAKNFELISEYFLEKRNSAPRVCVKGNLLRGKDSLVVSVFRMRTVDYTAEYEVSKNTGFEHCVETGRYYLENDLPQAVNTGRYKNPRIDYDRVREVQSTGLIGRRRALCENWSHIWRDGDAKSGDHYQSTMVVPMTILNANLSSEFLEKFGNGTADRLIFGFLCLDHPDANFFDQEDVDTAYVFADLISLFAYNLANFTTYSETYKAASERMARGARLSAFDSSTKATSFESRRPRALRERTMETSSLKNVLVYLQKNREGGGG